MNTDPEVIREDSPATAARETAPTVSRSGRAAGRASMREEFLALFRDTRLGPTRGEPSGLDQSGDGTLSPPGTPTHAAPEPSRFLRRFLQQATPESALAPSGLAGLDLCLGGGLGFGVHLVLGPPASGKTAFLDSLAWEAVADKRPALYYALKTGSLHVWERLMTTLGTILDGPTIAPTALRGHGLVPTDLETLGRLDAALQTSVLPYLSLIDASPGFTGHLSAFVEDVRCRAQESGEQTGRLPLVLVDDLDRLLALTGSRSPTHLLSQLDDALAGESIPGLLAGSVDGILPVPLERLPVRTVLTLTPAGSLGPAESPTTAGSGTTAGSAQAGPVPTGAATPDSSPSSTPERVELEVRKNRATGWTGSLSLLLDPSSGLFAEFGAGPPCPPGDADPVCDPGAEG